MHVNELFSAKHKGGFRERFDWSQTYIPAVKRYAGQFVLEVASAAQDKTEATDLIVLKGGDLKIAARVRKPGFWPDFKDQFTVRCHLERWGTTELDKIIGGFADRMVYAHADPAEDGELAHGMFIDLDVFRAVVRQDPDFDGLVTDTQNNGDGTGFRWFDVRSFPPELVIDRF